MEANVGMQVNASVNYTERAVTGRPAQSTQRQDAAHRVRVEAVRLDIAAGGENALDVPLPVGDEEISEATIARYIDNVNQALEPSHFRLNFGVHEPTNRIMVRVVDTDTDEIRREIPAESRLDITARLQEFAGLLFDEIS
jgi:flagellar protein FlaG